ncbi:Hypothetical predicted protein, partial [Podarcis lilfordi]
DQYPIGGYSSSKEPEAQSVGHNDAVPANKFQSRSPNGQQHQLSFLLQVTDVCGLSTTLTATTG